MENSLMGRVVVSAKIENLEDMFRVRKGELTPDQIRSVIVDDALVDTGASTLALPKRLIDELGLAAFEKKRSRSVSGTSTVQVYGTVQLTVQDRQWRGDVIEVADDCPVLISQIPLEFLDFVVDPKEQRLIGNPRHGGEQMLELY